MLADLIREFCGQPENDYEVYENYTKHFEPSAGREPVTTIGIVVRKDQNYFEMLSQLTRFLESKEFTDPLMELMETGVGELSPEDTGRYDPEDVVVYFPSIQDYHPLQP